MANHLGLALHEIDITPMAEPYILQNSPMCQTRMGNILSRLRMTILFDKSALHNALVLGTANKSEILLGYTTWFGDSACSVNPLGNLYKTQVWQISRQLGIPAELVEKAPSADHAQGQTDEKDLGYNYKDIDILLERLTDRGESENAIIESGADADFVKSIAGRVGLNSYKRKMPVIL
jgi:NAD+ synthase